LIGQLRWGKLLCIHIDSRRMESQLPGPRIRPAATITDVEQLLPYARKIVNRTDKTKFLTTGYGKAEPGDRVLMAVRSLHDPLVIEALVRAFREKDIAVDVITVDYEPDFQRTVTLDYDFPIVFDSDEKEWYEGYIGRFKWAEDLAIERGYDFLIEVTAGALPSTFLDADTPYHAGRIPWQSAETLASDATHYPQELLLAIAEKFNDIVWEEGPGSTVHMTDPEGTDLTYTFAEEALDNSPEGSSVSESVWNEYYRDSYAWPRRSPPFVDNHLTFKPWPPLLKSEDANGVIASTHGHHSTPYPRLELEITDGKVTDVSGGGKLGDKVRTLHEETKDIQYPDAPDTGLLWVWEYAVGTNPKVVRPQNYLQVSGPGGLTERYRSGIVHLGIGTYSGGYDEDWAPENGHPYGHLDVHLNFPTVTFDTGEKQITLIEDGRLTVLDDPEIREVAAQYGDPDELLSESWIPPLPGFNTSGSYEEYAADPTAYLKEHHPSHLRF